MSSLPKPLGVPPVLRSDLKPRMAKVALAEVRKTDHEADLWQSLVGEAVKTVQLWAGLSLKEFADRLGKNERQVARWISGEDHAQFGAIFAVPEFRALAVLALAQIAKENVEVIHEVRIRA